MHQYIWETKTCSKQWTMERNWASGIDVLLMNYYITLHITWQAERNNKIRVVVFHHTYLVDKKKTNSVWEIKRQKESLTGDYLSQWKFMWVSKCPVFFGSVVSKNLKKMVMNKGKALFYYIHN